jgi:hypothetical protein
MEQQQITEVLKLNYMVHLKLALAFGKRMQILYICICSNVLVCHYTHLALSTTTYCLGTLFKAPLSTITRRAITLLCTSKTAC